MIKRFDVDEVTPRELQSCACEHPAHHEHGRCKANVVREGVTLPCPCRSCFCFACYLKGRE